MKFSHNKKTYILVSIIFLLVLLISGAYSFFSVNFINSSKVSSITGNASNLGTPYMKTIISNLYLNLNASLMSQDNAGTTYFANSDSAGTALTTNPNYTLAEVSLTNGTTSVDCTYNFKATATVIKSISDGSDSDVKVVVGEQTLTLSELIAAGSDGVTVSGNIKNLTTGTNQVITISSSVTNTVNTQDNLIDNTYTITVEPYSNGDTKVFSCKLRYQISSEKTLAQNLIDSGWLWQSNLEGDDYRFIGSGTATQDAGLTNFVCFGTTDKDTCTANSSTYMYRVIGVFSDESGNNHVKLIKYKHLSSRYKWHSDKSVNINWADSDLYNGLNGSYFLTNTTYSYMQDSAWLNKIENWTWTAVNTKTFGSGGLSYYNFVSPANIYLHEMNRTGKTSTIGEWTTPESKIGLMYTSDYVLSLGEKATNINTGTLSNKALLKTGWLHQTNNDINANSWEWLMARAGSYGSNFTAWTIDYDGYLNFRALADNYAVRPVFYLTSDILGTGTGMLDDPIILDLK